MKMITLARRNTKELLRDPLTLFFGIAFPLVLLLLLSAIQANVPVALFRIDMLAPGIVVFGLSFVTLFAALIIAKDRNSAFLQRLYTMPIKAADFVLGYVLPLLPLSLVQSFVCYAMAVVMGLELSVSIFAALVLVLPVALLYIFLGLLFGSILNEKQVGGIVGALLTNLSAWLSGIWFDLSLVGGAFEKIASLFPFVHAVELQRAAASGAWASLVPHLLWVVGYTVVIGVAAVVLFLRQMKKR